MIRWLGVIKPGTIINDIGAHEDTYNWTNGEWTVPINFQISQVFKIGDQPMQAFVGPRYYADKPADGPQWGLRFGLVFLFGK